MLLSTVSNAMHSGVAFCNVARLKGADSIGCIATTSFAAVNAKHGREQMIVAAESLCSMSLVLRPLLQSVVSVQVLFAVNAIDSHSKLSASRAAQGVSAVTRCTCRICNNHV